jgi:hypothetical protein
LSPKKVRNEEIVIFWVSKVSMVSKSRFVLFKKEKRNFELFSRYQNVFGTTPIYGMVLPEEEEQQVSESQ